MSISSRLSLVTIAATVILATILLTLAGYSVEQVNARLEQTELRGKRVLWQKIEAALLDDMAANASSITRSRETLAAVAARDPGQLEAEAMPLHLRLTGQGVIDGLTLFDDAGRVLFSTPAELARREASPVTRRALAEGTLARGLERGVQGRLLAVVAFPLYVRGQLVGAAAYERALQVALEDFKQNDGGEVGVLGPDGTLQYDTAGADYAGWRHPPGATATPSIGVQPDRERLLRVVSTPLNDAEGQVIGRLLVAHDETESLRTEASIRRITLGLAVLVVVLTGLGVFLLIRRALQPLQRVLRVTESIARGDLSMRVGCRRTDEIGQLGAAVDTMTGQLRGLVNRITGCTTQLAAAAEEMSIVTDQTRRGMSDQSRQTDQVATAVVQLSASVEEVARHTATAVQAAREADLQVGQGREVVRQVADAIVATTGGMEQAAAAIGRLRSHSEAIGTVLDVIRGIAEQTNLLALNAAIEAARAGEQGRGFAVVADEVRTLAGRTQQSTREIQEMIERLQAGAREAVTTVEEGRQTSDGSVERATRAGESLARIATAMEAILAMSEQIAAATQEQSTVTHNISQNIVAIRDVGEDTNRSATHTADASEQLARLAVELQEIVGTFRLGDPTAADTPAPAV